MIRCKLVETIHPDDTQVGARVGRAVSGETLGLGRAAACKIYLPDPRVRLDHALVRRAEDGFLYLEAAGPVTVNQKIQTSVRLAVGQHISIGPYDFIVEGVDDGPERPDPRLTLSFALRAQALEPGRCHAGHPPRWASTAAGSAGAAGLAAQPGGAGAGRLAGLACVPARGARRHAGGKAGSRDRLDRLAWLAGAGKEAGVHARPATGHLVEPGHGVVCAPGHRPGLPRLPRQAVRAGAGRGLHPLPREHRRTYR